MNTLVALAATKEHAEQILHRFRSEVGLQESELVALLPGTAGGPDYAETEELLTEAYTTPATRKHGMAGGVLGALIGAGAVIIPGLQPLLLAGAGVAIFGSLLGAAAGGAIGAMTGLALPDATVEKYRARVRDGAYLLGVHTESEEKLAHARRIFEEAKAEDIAETVHADVPA